VASSKVVGSTSINFVMYVAYPEYLVGILLSLKDPLVVVSRMIIG